MNATLRRGAAMQHPPSRVQRGSSIGRPARQIHDSVSKGTELWLPKRFSEEVSKVIRGVDVRHSDGAVFHQLPHVEMPSSDVLRALMIMFPLTQNRFIRDSRYTLLVALNDTLRGFILP